VLVCGVVLSGAQSTPVIAAETTPASASEEIARVLAEPEFNQYKEVKNWSWRGNVDKDDEQTEPQSPEWANFWANLALLFSDIWQGLMWTAIAILVAIAFYVLRKFIPEPRAREAGDYVPPANLFGLNVSPESLPEDIGAAASVLVREGRLREALSLLYRGALSVLIHRHRVIVRAGDTEGDCERAAQAGLPREASGYFSRLLAIWRQAAYAGSETESQTVDELCRDWTLYFVRSDYFASGPGQQAQS
jgi:hypothetical protein